MHPLLRRVQADHQDYLADLKRRNDKDKRRQSRINKKVEAQKNRIIGKLASVIDAIDPEAVQINVPTAGRNYRIMYCHYALSLKPLKVWISIEENSPSSHTVLSEVSCAICGWHYPLQLLPRGIRPAVLLVYSRIGCEHIKNAFAPLADEKDVMRIG